MEIGLKFKEDRKMATYKKKIDHVDAEAAANKIVAVLKSGGLEGIVCGSLRRGRETVGDIDIAVRAINEKMTMPEIYMQALATVQKLDCEILTKIDDGKTKKSIQLLLDNVQCDIYLSEATNFGAMLLFFTGSQLFNIIIRGEAKRQGYKLNRYGLWMNDELIAGRTEEQIFYALGYEYLSPYNRSPETWGGSKQILKEKG